ncbi:hypothetical protein scyTo_0024856, partial [Scyliorhinus torazame]|nr:hypothetical protein [Scyliorhinus torazame]
MGAYRLLKLPGNMTEEERNLSKAVMSYWATFAWNG